MNRPVEAGHLALHAPSVFNARPWRWRVGADSQELYPDRHRHLGVVDRDDRLVERRRAPQDRGAAYSVLFGDDETPGSWLRTGEALAAALLTGAAIILSGG